MVPQYCSYGFAGMSEMPAMPATITFSGCAKFIISSWWWVSQTNKCVHIMLKMKFNNYKESACFRSLTKHLTLLASLVSGKSVRYFIHFNY